MIVFVFDTKEECDQFTFLYENYYKLVWYTIFRFIDDSYLAEDLLNDIYILIGRHLDKIDIHDKARTRNYIITVARNYCLTYLRRKDRIGQGLTDNEKIFTDEARDPLKRLIDKEDFEHLTAEISALDDKYRMVLELRYINDFSFDEIAEFLNINVHTVRMRLCRAKNMLRGKIGERL